MKFYTMKVNLAILYGIDDKFSIVKNTIHRCHTYFDKILLINSGGEYTRQKLESIKTYNMYIYEQNIMWGDTDSSRRYALNLCDYNDWMFWLDSDECPSKILLDNLQKIIISAENEGCSNIRFPSSSHIWNVDDGSCDGTNNVFNPQCSYYGYDENNKSRQPKNFLYNRMLKRINGAYFVSSCGGHSQFSVPNDIWKYSNYPINHYKTTKTCTISVVLHTWASMRPNFTMYHDIKDLYLSEEYHIHTKFKIKYNVETSNKLLYKLMQYPLFKEDIKDVYYKKIMKTSKFHFTYIYELIDKYDFDFSDDVGNYECSFECCKY